MYNVGYDAIHYQRRRCYRLVIFRWVIHLDYMEESPGRTVKIKIRGIH